jgi:hypothetical protein
MRKLIGLMGLIAAMGVLGASATSAVATEETPLGTAESSAEPSTETGQEEAGEAASESAPESSLGSVSPLGSTGCFANDVCVYNGEYDSFLAVYECSSSGNHSLWPGHGTSARNRCGNKTAWLRWEGNTIACMNPGGDRPNPGWFNSVYISAEYGAFC